MFCSSCGAQVSDGAKFCPSCGNKISVSGSPVVPGAPVAPNEVGTVPVNTVSDAEKPWYYKTPARIAIGLVGALLVISGISRIMSGLKGLSSTPPAPTVVAEPDSEPEPTPSNNVYVVSFDGNGADTGNMDTVEVVEGNTLTLPQCEFSRDGYMFTYWTTNSTGSHSDLLYPGDEYQVRSQLILFANWYQLTPVHEHELTRRNELQQDTFEELGTDGHCALLVTNGGDFTAHFDAEVHFFDVAGQELGSVREEAFAVSPADRALINIFHTYDTAVSATYYLRSTSEDSYNETLDGEHIQVEVLETTPDTVSYRLSNISEEDAQITNVRMLARTDDGPSFVCDSYTAALLKPGESVDAVFERTAFYEYNADMDIVPSLQNLTREVYINGYIVVPHESTDSGMS